MKWINFTLAFAILYATIMSWLWIDAQHVVAPRFQERPAASSAHPISPLVPSSVATRPPQSLDASSPSTEVSAESEANIAAAISARHNGSIDAGGPAITPPLNSYAVPIGRLESRRGANEGSGEQYELNRAVEKTMLESAVAFEGLRAIAAKR